MKKAQKAQREFEKIKSQLSQTAHIVRNTKDSKLWDHEAIVRKRIKALKAMDSRGFRDYPDVLERHFELLNEISRRLLDNYNKRKRTDYQFDEIVATDHEGYVSSGIISVLVTSHIPKLVAAEFKRCFAENPKDEYAPARAMHRSFTLHLGETNTGKTYTAIERLKQAENGVYLAPLRILALENYERLNREGVPCDLVTGEEELLIDGARHVCMTIEKLDLSREYDVAVIDEVQMVGSGQRGQAWTRALLGLRCREIHVCGASNAEKLVTKMLKDCGDAVELKRYKRNTPLEVCNEVFSLNHIERGDALVAFSKRRVLELSKFLQDKGIRSSVIYGDLPPEVRRMQYHDFVSGKSRLLVTTDAIGMGVNLPIRRIIFMDLMKFDGEEKRYINSQETKQIAGRAGRLGIYDVGYVCTARAEIDFLSDNLDTDDEPIRQAVVGPGEAIMTVKGLPLREKLALWSTSEERVAFYRKMDVRDYLLVLENLRQFKLPEAAEYRLMLLPFDVNDPELLRFFLMYVDEHFIRGHPALSKPLATGPSLHEQEQYYRKLGLYYSFSRNFSLTFDPEWIYDERAKTSEKINSLLVKL